MDFGQKIKQFLNDSSNVVSNYFGNAANAVVNEVHQLPQQIQSVVQPVEQNVTNFGQNLLNGVGQQAQYAIQNKNAFGQPNSQPFGLSNPFAPAPRVNLTGLINTGNPITDFAAKTLAGIPESVLNAPSDIQKAVPQDIQDIQNGQIKNPGTTIRDVAQTALPVATLATLGGGTLAKGIAENVGKEAGYDALGQALKEGAVSGVKYGGAFGILQGLAGSNQIPQQLLGAAQQGLIGAGVGGILGGATGGIANRIGAIQDSLANHLQQKYGMDPATATDAVQQFARDELGRFVGGVDKTPNGTGGVAVGVRQQLGMKQSEPVFYGDLRQAIGLPREGNYQAGFIKPDEFIPGAKTEEPIAPPEISLKDQLNQPPLPPKMSLKAIKEGIETPTKGSDISVSPQASLRYKNAQNVIPENSEPLPWENMNNPQAVGDILKGGKYKFDEQTGTTQFKNTPEPKEPIVTNPNGTIKQAREAMYSAQAPILERGKVLQQLVREGVDTGGEPKEGESPTNYGENKLFRQAIEHPEMRDEITGQVKNPTKFNKAIDAFQDFTDHAYNQFKDAGSKIGFLEDYYSHILDLSKPGEAERLQEFVNAKAKNFKGWYNKVRTFQDIEELESHGFDLKNKNVVDDINEYTNAVSRELGGRVLSNELQKINPKEVYISNGDAAPANLFQSRIPGMKGTYVSKNILSQLKDLEPQEGSKLGGLINKAQQGIKETKLAGGLFHIQNTGADYLAGQLGLGKVPRLDTAVKIFFSPSEDAKYRQENIDSGLTDKAAKMQVTFSTEHDLNKTDNGIQKVAKGIDKVNPFSILNRATFSRLEDFFKMETVKALDKRGLVNTDTPEGLKVAKDYGRQINNMFGGQNRVAGDDIFNKNPVTRFVANNALLLAPDYQQGRFKRTLSALKPFDRNGANNFAAGTLAIRIAGAALIAEALRRAITGKFSPNLISALQNDVMNPSFPSPWQNNKKDQIVHLPGTNVQDMVNLASDPEHFLISHLPGGTSDALSYLSNQDYFGNKLSDTNNPLEKGLKLAGSNLPIPVVQAQKVLSGKEDIRNAALNFLGNRVSTDPNDPTMVYFKNLDAARNSLTDPTQQKVFDSIMARERDVNGNTIPMTPANRMANALELLNNPQVLAAITKEEQTTAKTTGKPVNPLYNLTPDQQKIVLEYQSQLPGPERTNALYVNNNLPVTDPNRGLLQNFFQQQQQFFSQLPASTNPNKQDASLTPPTATPYVQKQLSLKNYSDPQVKKYLQADTAYKNAVRGTIGAPLLSSYGSLPADEAKYQQQAAQRQNSSLFRTLSRKVKSQHSLSIKTPSVKKGKSLSVKSSTPKISGKLLSLKGKPFAIRTKF